MGDGKESRVRGSESGSGRSVETMWTAVPPDDRREKENTQGSRGGRGRLMIERDALLDKQEGSLIHACYLSTMSRFCIVEAISSCR
jgi:hypothetical protein